MNNFKNWLISLLTLLLAFILYSLLGAVDPALIMLINPFVVAVFFASVIYGEVAGLLMGTAAGLIQDAFSYGVFGLAGFSYTISGFLAGWFSQKLSLNSFNKRFLFSFFFALFQLSLWITLYALIFKKSILYTQPFIYLQTVVTALLVSGLVWLFRKLKSKEETD
ncbi:MAG: rod shape-determining protein MreD [Candidatus Saccharicenans sp.]